MDHKHLNRLRQGLSNELPGHAAFLEHTGYDRTKLEKALQQDDSPRLSAVLICLYPRNDKWHTTLMKRPSYEGVHSGQIAFPGGRMEKEDVNLKQTALREFAEETGSALTNIRFIGELSQLYIPPSRSLVSPYIALSDVELEFDPDPVEVERLIEVPLSEMLRDDLLKRTDRLEWALGKGRSVPYFDIDNELVWGATALMIAELRQVCGVEFH